MRMRASTGVRGGVAGAHPRGRRRVERHCSVTPGIVVGRTEYLQEAFDCSDHGVIAVDRGTEALLREKDALADLRGLLGQSDLLAEVVSPTQGRSQPLHDVCGQPVRSLRSEKRALLSRCLRQGPRVRRVARSTRSSYTPGTGSRSPTPSSRSPVTDPWDRGCRDPRSAPIVILVVLGSRRAPTRPAGPTGLCEDREGTGSAILAEIASSLPVQVTQDGTTMATPPTSPITPDIVSALVVRAAKAFNDHDAHGFTAVMVPDVEFIHSALPEIMHGRAEVAATYSEQFWQAFPDLTIELKDGPLLHPTAPRAAVDWQVRGTHLGPLSPPGLAPTGRAFSTVARELLTIEDGLARRIHLIMDMADVMRQLGVLPASGSRGEAAMMATQRWRQLPRRLLKSRS